MRFLLVLSFLLSLIVPTFGQSAPPPYYAPMVPNDVGAMFPPYGLGPMLPGAGPMVPNTGINSGPSGPPTVTAVIPNSGPTGGGTAVLITGTNFTGATAVNFGAGNPATFTVVSATAITVASNPSGSAGTIDVRVTTPLGTSAIVAADQFTYSTCTQSLNFTQACNSQYIVAIGF